MGSAFPNPKVAGVRRQAFSRPTAPADPITPPPRSPARPGGRPRLRSRLLACRPAGPRRSVPRQFENLPRSDGVRRQAVEGGDVGDRRRGVRRPPRRLRRWTTGCRPIGRRRAGERPDPPKGTDPSASRRRGPRPPGPRPPARRTPIGSRRERRASGCAHRARRRPARPHSGRSLSDPHAALRSVREAALRGRPEVRAGRRSKRRLPPRRRRIRRRSAADRAIQGVRRNRKRQLSQRLRARYS